MSNEAITWAYREVRGIGLTAKAVLVRLADQANSDGIAWPGKNSLAEVLDCDKRTVDRAIEKLISLGLISVQESLDEAGRNKTNVYCLHMNQGDLFGEKAAPGVAERRGWQSATHGRAPRGGVAESRVRGGTAPPKPSVNPQLEPSESNDSEPAALDHWQKGEQIGVPRSVIGRWIRDHGERQAQECIEHLADKRPADPVQYGAAWLQNRLRLPDNDHDLEKFVRQHGLPDARRDDTYATWRARLRQVVKEINQQGRATCA